MAKRPDNFRGMDLTSPINRVEPGKATVAVNARGYGQGQFELRNQLSPTIVIDSSPIVLDSSAQSLIRMNDTTPAGPASGYVYISGDAAGNIYVNDSIVGSGFSGNSVSQIPFRPNASVEPWDYIGDNSENVTIYTKYALNDSSATFNCFGQVKVRSDGLIYKTGIQEPPLAPVVSTSITPVVTSGTLDARTIPWTNVSSANSSYNYGQTKPVSPPIDSNHDGTAPYLINCANASYITINSITGSATINGGTKTPTSLGPSTAASTNPGHYIQIAGTGGTPATATVVVGAFTDGNGNVIAAGVAPLFVPSVVDVGAAFLGSLTIQVPSGAQAFQIGINSTGNTFSSNSGSFAISVTVTTQALPSVLSILGTLTAHYWGDSPTSGAVAAYIWKNPGDSSGSGPSRSTSDAIGSTTGNSFIFDASFGSSCYPVLPAGIPGVPAVDIATGGSDIAVPMQWATLSSESVAVGSSALFAAPITTPYSGNTNYDNFNFCLTGNIYVPAAGQYTFVLTCKDDLIWGIGGGATVVSSSAVLSQELTSGTIHSTSIPTSTSGSSFAGGGYGQTITVAEGYPLLPRATPTSAIVFPATLNWGEGGIYAATTVVVNFPSAGIYPIEIDYDFWYHSGRILLLMASPTPSASPTIIPPLPQAVRTGVSYAGKYRSSLTGAQSNPSPTTTAITTPILASTAYLPYSPDPQVDKCDYYRQDEGLANYTYVATGPNTNPPTAITDSLTDLEAANNPQMTYDDYEPVPSLDLPKSGHCIVSGGVITTLDTPFNTRWLPGTIILIGYPTQLPYTFISRPTSTSQVTIPGVPDGTDLVWNIAQPALANQPLPYRFGPTDNINYVFAVGDPNRPGTIYWSKGSNLDSWPDTNQFDVTDPSEALVNGAMSGGRAILFSIKRGWVMTPNFFNALATVTGTSGSTWTAEDASITRGLFIPRCLIVQGGGKVFFRVDDGIHYSPKGIGSQSITDDDLYPLFVHEGSTPVPVVRNGITIYPPNDSLPERQKFSQQGPFMYYNYVGTDGNPHTLVFDTEHMGWVWDMYDPPATIHASNQGESQQGNLVGCADGSVRLLVSEGAAETATVTVATPAIGGSGFQHIYEMTVEYASEETMTVTPVAVDVGNGSYAPNPIVLPSTGGEQTKYTTKVSANKWKWLQFVFTSSDPAMQVNLDGFAVEQKAWGDNGAYRTVQPFKPSGGVGAQK